MNPTVRTALESALRSTGFELQASGADVVTYAAASAAKLTLATAELSFGEAVQSEADRVFMFAAKRAVRAGDATDALALGIIHGILLGLAGA